MKEPNEGPQGEQGRQGNQGNRGAPGLPGPPGLNSTDEVLEDLLLGLTKEIGELGKKVEHETEIREQKLKVIEDGQDDIKRARSRDKKVLAAVLAGVLIALAAAGIAINASDKATTATASAVYDRCVQGNRSRAATKERNTSMVNYIDKLLVALTGPTPDPSTFTPEQQERVADVIKTRQEQLDANNDPSLAEVPCGPEPDGYKPTNPVTGKTVTTIKKAG